MPNAPDHRDRTSLLADVAEMYYLKEMDQSAIAREVGVTRSMVSRMLTEARSRGIVEIRVIRPIHQDHSLESNLKARFEIESVFVLNADETRPEKLLAELGRAGAEVLQGHLRPAAVVGVTWGTSVSAVVDAIQPRTGFKVSVVQFVGAQGAMNAEYDGHALVKRLAEKFGGDGYYLNAPCLCPTAEIAESMRGTRGIHETIEMGKHCQIALLGIGTTETEYSSFYLSGQINEKELREIRAKGVAGDIGGNYFTQDGCPYMDDFLRRMITIRWEDLQRIPVRIGIAGGPGKAAAIGGALRTGLLTHLVTDSITARLIPG